MHLQRGRDSIAIGARSAIRAVELHGSKNLDNAQFHARIPDEELLQVIEAQYRRIQRGDYVPVRRQPQPLVAGVEKQLRSQIKHLENENHRLKRLSMM